MYQHDTLDEALDQEIAAFCTSEIQIIASKKKIVLPVLFKWYYNDFGRQDSDILLWIKNYLNDQQKIDLESIINTNLLITYSPHTWNLNGRILNFDEDVII